jgi:hypothetical protein
MQLHTEVQDGQIVVTLPQSGYYASYRRAANIPQLLRSAFATDLSNEPISKEEFFAIAWDAASARARVDWHGGSRRVSLQQPGEALWEELSALDCN